MHKRKYTKEQLEFYFKKLMGKLKHIPREEDMEKAKGFPSVTVYVERFGSWNDAVAQFANFDLAKSKCKNCGKEFLKMKKTQKYCSDTCAQKKQSKKYSTYSKAIDKKIKEILHNECFVCDFDSITEIHCLDNKKESKTKILKAYLKKDLHTYVVLCPNHHLMVHQKLGKIYYKGDELIWGE
ncbi:MAG: hypothetical protein WC916_05850 [Candidatus Woesearchaeota archaeon]